ncbi:short-chain dehydrogenase [Rhodocollybia butyracea]|uniref:Short-chain dehydrogenase n=1 Tax=Rhodocollybia butyracea TaxID=206335 RepID=A0A9P5PX86_9AGAR|nr:short-chain dehydrogenase [Rhodocollybia butyracea]
MSNPNLYATFTDRQKQTSPSLVHEDLTGKTVMITGANSGIGFEAAKHFATMNPARLIVVCRSMEKAQASITQIEAETGYKNAEPMALDLGDFNSISEFATQANKTLERLDILVENAAIATTEYVLTRDGWETMLQVNSLGPALHVILLLPIILRTAKQHSVVSRVVIVSSEVIFFANIRPEAIASPNILETLSSKEYCTAEVIGESRYTESKILNNMLVNKLTALLPLNIVPVALSPGFCISGLRRNIQGEAAERYKRMEDQIAYTSEEGSRLILHAALAGRNEEIRGTFLSYLKPHELPDHMLSEEGKRTEDKIWNEMLELFSQVDDRVRDIVVEYLK